jgi:peroxiredoxin
LQAYQSILPDIQALGATLVAVSPQLPDNSLSAAEKNGLQFEVLSDERNAVARQYGIVWRFPEELRTMYLSVFGIVLPEYNGDDSWELPIPATFVIGQDSFILHAFVDPDYTRRAEPADILDALRSG